MNKINEYIDFFYNAGFDLHPLFTNSKKPVKNGWTTAKKLTKDEIDKLFDDKISEEHAYNVGFRPGRLSNNIIVIDVDIKGNDKHRNGLNRDKLFNKDTEERAKYKERADFVGDLLESYNLTANTITGSGGYHCYLKIENNDFYNSLNLKANQTIFKNDDLGIEIELLADGKNVVLPPSVVAYGDFLRRYALINENINNIDADSLILELILNQKTPEWIETNIIETAETDDKTDDNITALVKELANHKDKINGYDFQMNFIGYCVDNRIADRIPALFKIFYGSGYDAKLTQSLIEKAKNRQNIRHAGSFIKMLKDANLGELVDKYLKSNKEQEIVVRDLSKMDESIANIDNLKKTEFNLMFPAGKLSLIVGNGSVGKTYIALYIALLFVKMNPGKTVFLLMIEDDQYNITKRTMRLIESYPFLYSDQIKNIHFICDSDEELIKIDNFTKKIYYNTKSGLKEIIESHNLNILDPLANLLPTDENDNNSANRFCKIIRSFINETNNSVVFLHHVNKVKIEKIKEESVMSKNLDNNEVYDRIDKVRGASAFYNAVRYCLYAERFEDKGHDSVVTSVIKNNYGRIGEVALQLELPAFETSQINDINIENIENKSIIGIFN